MEVTKRSDRMATKKHMPILSKTKSKLIIAKIAQGIKNKSIKICSNQGNKTKPFRRFMNSCSTKNVCTSKLTENLKPIYDISLPCSLIAGECMGAYV